MKRKVSLIFRFSTRSSKRLLKAAYGDDFYRKFYKSSKNQLTGVLSGAPDIGKSIFAVNYYFCICYIAWYKAFLELGMDKEEANMLIWKMNEELMKLFPGASLRFFAKHLYLGSFRRKAPRVEKQAKEGTLHPFDWKLRYKDISPATFELHIYECGMIKLCKKFNIEGLLPSICRMDYLFSHYMGNGFARTKTLGDGDDCCNCRYSFPGECEWEPEKGFADRK